MTCQACGGEATTRPALCDDCRAEREQHGRAKATARRAALTARTLDDRPPCRVCGARLGRAEARAGDTCVRCLRVARAQEATT